MKRFCSLLRFGLPAAALIFGTAVWPASAGTLQPQRIRSSSQLLKLLKQHQPRYYGTFRTGLSVLAAQGGPVAVDTAFSQTVVQVAGVDEGDQVKNDGRFIYQVNQDRVLIIQAYPETDLSIAATLDFSDGSFYPQELYLDSHFLVVVGTAFHDPSTLVSRSLVRRLRSPIQFFSTSTVQAKIYDIADPAHPRKVREIEIDGDYVATRKIGSSLYMVSRQYPPCYALGTLSSAWLRLATPAYRDSRRGKAFRNVSPLKCLAFPGFDDPNYLVVAGVDLAKPNSLLNVAAYLGAGDQVYASTNNLYVTASRYLDPWLLQPMRLTGTAAVIGAPAAGRAADLTTTIAPADPLPPVAIPPSETTQVYRFALSNSQPVFAAATEVPGTLKNAYSMDEYAGYLRVATTRHGWWFGPDQSTNSLYVLDSTLNLTGSLDNIAPGEEIYAARFLGSRLFLVTFRQIYPLFGIDLSDPHAPVVVGQLTLPGYSTFLVPYDASHLIGFGKDVNVMRGATEGDVPWWEGAAFYQGLKLALFDVTDLQNPTLLSSVSIGDRGSDSPVLSDPHALLFDPGRHLLVFPLTVAQLAEPDPTQPWRAGDPVFQGAYAYQVTPEAGFTFQGSITHIAAGDHVWSAWDCQINRVVRIGNDLFTLSPAEIKANDLTTLAEKASLALPPGQYGVRDGGVITIDARTGQTTGSTGSR